MHTDGTDHAHADACRRSPPLMTIATPPLTRQPLPRRRRAEADTSPIRVGLLGAGQVGSAVAALARSQPPALSRQVTIAVALVRDPEARPRPPGLPLDHAR